MKEDALLILIGVLGMVVFMYMAGTVVPNHGDVLIRDGQSWEYRCNWAGCDWFRR